MSAPVVPSKRQQTTRMGLWFLFAQGLQAFILALVWMLAPGAREDASVLAAAMGLFSTLAFCIMGIVTGHVAGDTVRPSGQGSSAFGGGSSASPSGARLPPEVAP